MEIRVNSVGNANPWPSMPGLAFTTFRMTNYVLVTGYVLDNGLRAG